MLKHKKVQLPQDWFGKPIWPQFHWFRSLHTNMVGVTSCENALLAITRLHRKKGTCCPNNQQFLKKIGEKVMMGSFLVLITIFSRV